MLLFVRSSDAPIDAKLQRYMRAATKADILHAALYWDRDKDAGNVDNENRIIFRAPLAYTARSRTLLCLILLNIFIMWTIWRRRHALSLVHAIDLDTAVAASLICKFTGIPYFYDIYDHYADSRGLAGWKRKLFAWLEKHVIRGANTVVLADQYRIQQHAALPCDRILIIENVPDIRRHNLPPRSSTQPDRPLIRIGYLGTLEPVCRGIEDMLAVVEAMPQVQLDIAGQGALRNTVISAAKRCSRIRFHGPMQHSDGLALLQSLDVVMGLYYRNNPNHKFAAPNKYFEHLLIGRPLLTSLGTPPGAKVERYATGWAIQDGASNIRGALECILTRPEEVERRGARALQLWEQDFTDYSARVIDGQYVVAIRRASRTAETVPRRTEISGKAT